MNAIDDFIHQLPPEKAAMVSYLRQEICKANPRITERIAYGLPFFYCGKPLCFLNIKKHGCDVCFMDGNLIAQHPAFIAEKRVRVRSLFFRWEVDVDVALIQQVLAEILKLEKFQKVKPQR